MIAIATVATLCLGFPAVQAEPVQTPAVTPFQMELPAGYSAFQQPQPGGEVWSSVHEAGDASFEVHHYLLAAPGAITDLVADNLRKTRWLPMLVEVKHQMTPWKGKWATVDAAGTSIEYLHTEDSYRYLEQRLVVLDDHLIIVNWEGNIGRKQAGEMALNSFRIPDAWRPQPAPEVDLDRGFRPGQQQPDPIGHFHIRVDATDPAFHQVDFEVTWRPADGVTPNGQQWRLPEGADLLEATPTKVSYRIRLFDQPSLAPPGGLIALASGMSGFGGAWLALPTGFEPTATRYAPPPHTLEILCPAFLEPLSGTSASKSTVNEETVVRYTQFQPNLDPTVWPYFVLGMYEYKKVGDHAAAIRKTSKASRYEKTLTALIRLQRGLSEWLPNATSHWSVTTFRGCGDLILPGMLVFDENNQWLADPVDADWIDGNRRAGLARKLSSHVFGRQLSGVGHGSVFLDASLAEYAAWRILQSSGLANEADTMVEFWLRNEKALDVLPRPLTLMPFADLQGAKRLMTRGALVWQAIEEKATRPKLDQALNALLKSNSKWTTEDLRKALDQHTNQSWLPFFQAHVYGKKRP